MPPYGGRRRLAVPRAVRSSALWTGNPETLPALPGAYVLLIGLESSVPAPPCLGGFLLPPGLYAYAGSAYGPGGLRARVGRHIRRDKTKRWHVDALTSTGAWVWARVWSVHPDSLPASDAASPLLIPNECTLARDLAAFPGAAIPVPGFGASDCPGCAAHLIALKGPRGPLGSALAADPWGRPAKPGDLP